MYVPSIPLWNLSSVRMSTPDPPFPAPAPPPPSLQWQCKKRKIKDPCSAFACHSQAKYNIPISILLLSAKPVIQVLLKVNVSFVSMQKEWWSQGAGAAIGGRSSRA